LADSTDFYETMTTRIRWGLIGCGDIARKRIAPALREHPNCDLHAVSRAQSDQAKSFAKEFGAPAWYQTWEELIADTAIDAIYIATPVHLHAVQAIAAARAGKHVLCEKPMAMNVLECDQMIRAARENGIRLGVAYYRHFYPVVRRVRELIELGEIGVPVLAQINAFEWFDPEPSHPRQWLLEKQFSGGGPMFDFGCHRIEVLIHLFGRPNLTRSIISNALFDRNVEDTATALFEFETGMQAVLSVTHGAFEPQDTLDIFGSKGSLHVRALNEGALTLKTSEGARDEFRPPAANLHLPLINEFVQGLLNDSDFEVDGLAGREVARVEEDIYHQFNAIS
jgi:predicted dehydrogenase